MFQRVTKTNNKKANLVAEYPIVITISVLVLIGVVVFLFRADLKNLINDFFPDFGQRNGGEVGEDKVIPDDEIPIEERECNVTVGRIDGRDNTIKLCNELPLDDTCNDFSIEPNLRVDWGDAFGENENAQLQINRRAIWRFFGAIDTDVGNVRSGRIDFNSEVFDPDLLNDLNLPIMSRDYYLQNLDRARIIQGNLICRDRPAVLMINQVNLLGQNEKVLFELKYIIEFEIEEQIIFYRYDESDESDESDGWQWSLQGGAEERWRDVEDDIFYDIDRIEEAIILNLRNKSYFEGINILNNTVELLKNNSFPLVRTAEVEIYIYFVE